MNDNVKNTFRSSELTDNNYHSNDNRSSHPGETIDDKENQLKTKEQEREEMERQEKQELQEKVKQKQKKTKKRKLCWCRLTCSICLEMYTTAAGMHRVCALKCGHLFGEPCVRSWYISLSFFFLLLALSLSFIV